MAVGRAHGYFQHSPVSREFHGMIGLLQSSEGASPRAERQSPREKTPFRQKHHDEILLRFLPLVRSVVERMKATLPSHLDADDLYSVGIAGLSRAVAKYDPEQESSFASYATMRIRGAVLDELRRMDWMSRGVRRKAKQLMDAVSEVEQRLGRRATTAEMAGELSLSTKAYEELIEKMQPIVYVELDASFPESEDESSLHETIADESQENACDRLQRKELIELLAARIERLPDMQRKILAMYYFEELRLAEIALVFGVTESRICQIHTQAVAALRGYLKSALAQ